MIRRRALLRANPDFARLWTAATVTNFGSMVTRLAVPFVAIQDLHASPAQLAVLAGVGLVPGVVVGPLAGAWADRRRRRPLLVASDLGRTALYLSVPAASLLGVLGFAQLYAVAFLAGALRSVFSVAHVAYLPSLVSPRELVRANSQLRAAESVTEGIAFGAAGWLVQLVTAPLTLAIDAASFAASAGLLASIRRREPEPRPSGTARRGLREAAAGLGATLAHPLLRRLLGVDVLLALAFGIFSVVFLLFVSDELGFPAGGLGMVFAVGAVSSLLGALAAERATRLLGARGVMLGGLAVAALLSAGVPLVPGVGTLGWVLLIAHQLGDGGVVAYGVHSVSLRQTRAPAEQLGRVNGSFEFAGVGAMLIGTALGGALGESVGLRATLWVAVVFAFGASLALLGAPVAESPPTRRA